MSALQPTRTTLDITRESERQLVRDELAHILQTPHFSHSKRYPALLTYIVTAALEGRAREMKERTLGIEVFHRRPDYDNNDDTVVRFTAGEVRKRLALIYHENGYDHPVQIEIPVGSYAPEFYRVVPVPWTETPAGPVTELAVAQTADAQASPSKRGWMSWTGLALAVVALLAGAYFAINHTRQQSALDRFWMPIQSGSVTVLLSPGAMVFSSASTSGVVKAQKTDEYPYFSVSSTAAVSRLTAMFGKENVPFDIVPSSAITLTDLRQHPVVLVGAYNNDWSLRLLSGMRYRFDTEPSLRIYDSANPAVSWGRPSVEMPQYKSADDFAVVARFSDKLTESFTVIIGGIGKNGTEAAAQFITSARYIQLLDRAAGKDWNLKNIEFVIRTKVIDGKTGPPSVEAIYVW